MKRPLIFFISLIFIFTSCTHMSASDSKPDEQTKSKNTRRIFPENDGTVKIEENNYKLSEIRDCIANQPEFDELHIHAEPETRMTVVYDLESICAEFGIPRLYYHALGDSLLALYKPTPVYPDNALIFTLSKEGVLDTG